MSANRTKSKPEKSKTPRPKDVQDGVWNPGRPSPR